MLKYGFWKSLHGTIYLCVRSLQRVLDEKCISVPLFPLIKDEAIPRFVAQTFAGRRHVSRRHRCWSTELLHRCCSTGWRRSDHQRLLAVCDAVSFVCTLSVETCSFSSCVQFNERNRVVGVAARQNLVPKLKQTVANVKHLIGRTYNDSEAQRQAHWLPCDMVQLADAGIGAQVC